MPTISVLDRERSLDVMWHAYRASKSTGQALIEIRIGFSSLKIGRKTDIVRR